MALSSLDQQIGLAAQDRNWKKVEELAERVVNDFWSTSEGEALAVCANRDAIPQRLMEEFHKRFDEDALYPGVLFLFRLVECAQDLLHSEAYIDEPEQEVLMPSEREAHAEKVAELRRLMGDDTTPAYEIKRLRESSVAYRKAWLEAGSLDDITVIKNADGASADLKKFAYQVNARVKQVGAYAARQPQAGRVYITPIGVPYGEFTQKLELAIAAGLIE